MKSLVDVIYNKSIDQGDIYKQYLNDLNEFYDLHIPEEIHERIINNEYVDYIDENLKTHDYKKLQKTLINKFDDIISFEDYNGEDNIKSFFIVLDDHTNVNEFSKNESFLNILEFFNYFFSEVIDNKLYIEPRYSTDKTSFIFNECNGICYHFCTNDKANKILKNGLRIKEGTYRMFPKRIYLYATPNIDINKDNKETLKAFINSVVSPFECKYKGLSILKININRIKNISLYKDTSMKSDNAFFTLTNIPSNYITKINIDI